MGREPLQSLAGLRLVRSARQDERVPALPHAHRRRQNPLRTRALRTQRRHPADHVSRLAGFVLGIQLRLGPSLAPFGCQPAGLQRRRAQFARLLLLRLAAARGLDAAGYGADF